jgi:hypothetical protein
VYGNVAANIRAEQRTQSQGQERGLHKETAPVPKSGVPASIGNIPQLDKQTSKYNQGNVTDLPDTYLRALVSPNNLPNVVLAGVGIVGIVVAVCTLRIIGQQTKVQVNSQRAWVAIFQMHPADLVAEPEGIPPYNAFRFTLKNGGNTVAKLIEFRGEPHIVQRNYMFPSPPVYKDRPPPFNEFGFRHGTVLTPSETLYMWVSIDELIIDNPVMQDIRKGEKELYVYGFLRYFDFSEKERRLQFCYRYRSREVIETAEGAGVEFESQWLLAGPPDYNTHT